MSDLSDLSELERYEEVLLDWMRTATIFFIAGIALYHFTSLGKPYSIIAFSLSIVLMITMIIDSISRRNDLAKKGITPRLALDIIIGVMVLAVLLVIWITYEVIIEPDRNNVQEETAIEALETAND